MNPNERACVIDAHHAWRRHRLKSQEQAGSAYGRWCAECGAADPGGSTGCLSTVVTLSD
jgi:hypothetical protein